MPFTLDMSEATQPPLPDGMYVLRCSNVRTGRVSQAGNDMLDVDFEVIQPEELAGRVHYEGFTMIKSNMWKFQPFIEAITRQEWKGTDMDFDEKEIVGLFVRASLVQEEARDKNGNGLGKKVARAKDWFPDLS